MQTWITPRRVVWLAAGAAALSRFPGLVHPPSPDEAGYLYVAQHWHPAADSVFGPYFVDRSPILVALFRIGDLIGGTPAVRLLAALGCALLVLAAAGLAREVTRDGRATAWTSVIAAALVGSAAIEPIIAKGEVLGIPLVVTALWLTLVGVRRSAGAPAFLAGVLAMTAVGLKQNMTTGLVFGAVYLIAATATGRLTRPAFARLGAAAAAGCAVPVLAVVVWAELAGVRLGEVWYSFFGFRTDAARAIAEGGDPYPSGRWISLVARAGWGGLAPFAVLFVARARSLFRTDPALTAAAGALFVTDGALLVLGGSWWPSYLFLLVPGTVVFVALLARDDVGWRWARWLGEYAVTATLVGAGFWAVQLVHPTQHDDPWSTGLAIGDAARPGDTIVAPGRPDLTAASGLTAPYPYLWPLIQVTLDPDAHQLARLLGGAQAPTWLVVVPPFTADDLAGLAPVLERGYVPHGVSCAGTPVYLHRGVERPPVTPDCDRTGY